MTIARSALAGLCLIRFTTTGLASSEPFVKLLGDRLPVGADMIVVLDSLPPGDSRILLASDDGGFQTPDELVAVNPANIR